MPESLKRLLARGDAELMLTSFSEDRTAEFVLRDCDGYLLGTLTCRGVNVLCLTMHSAMYEDVDWHDRMTVPSTLSWLKEAIPAGGGVLVFRLTDEDDEEAANQWGLPRLDGRHLAFVVCTTVSFRRSEKP